VVIDPSKATTSGSDPTLEVARRLRSLLEASGSAVLVTRSLSDSDVSAKARAQRAAEARATAVLGLDVLEKGPGGYAVSTPSGLSAAQIPAATELLNALVLALTVEGEEPERLTYPSDALAATLSAPMARVTLGSLQDRDDAASLKDPGWADSVARMLYRALGDQYGNR
jgi:N-acetylmuramoyl-L-alanine amidase